MKKKKKPTVKKLKVMDLKRLYPNRQQPEFKLTKRKVDAEHMKIRSVEIYGQNKLVELKT